MYGAPPDQPRAEVFAELVLTSGPHGPQAVLSAAPYPTLAWPIPASLLEAPWPLSSPSSPLNLQLQAGLIPRAPVLQLLGARPFMEHQCKLLPRS